LRAWAGYGVGAIGLLANDESMKEWARGSFKLVACAANPDGSLPLEMRRADRALNYQIHAVSPLVMTAVMLGSASFDGFSECNGALRKIVDFTLAAAKDPAIVEKINGKPQVFNAGDQVHDPFTMAWAEPYLAHVKDPALNAYVAPLRPLMNSKLGGNLTKIYGKNS
jgi:poly(beta-D-mannuronate) lyase